MREVVEEDGRTSGELAGLHCDRRRLHFLLISISQICWILFAVDILKDSLGHMHGTGAGKGSQMLKESTAVGSIHSYTLQVRHK